MSLYPLLTPLRRLGEPWVLALSNQRRIGSFTLYTEAESGEGARIAAAVRDSLDLIERVDPVRFALVRRYAGRILIVRTRRQQYWPVSGVSVLSTQFVERASAAYVAHVLICHAVQGRLARAGLYGNARVRARAESLGIHAQIAFARRLPLDEWPNVTTLLESLAQRLRELDGARADRRSPPG
ncbi:MAG TPA: hypothetical protein VLK84_30355 [Longimicrobium sp.]|nr:hypothetical protein [Longimicrobium sp.]